MGVPTNIVDMLTVCRSIGSIHTSSDTEVVYLINPCIALEKMDILEDMKLVHS